MQVCSSKQETSQVFQPPLRRVIDLDQSTQPGAEKGGSPSSKRHTHALFIQTYDYGEYDQASFAIPVP